MSVKSPGHLETAPASFPWQLFGKMKRSVFKILQLRAVVIGTSFNWLAWSTQVAILDKSSSGKIPRGTTVYFLCFCVFFCQEWLLYLTVWLFIRNDILPLTPSSHKLWLSLQVNWSHMWKPECNKVFPWPKCSTPEYEYCKTFEKYMRGLLKMWMFALTILIAIFGLCIFISVLAATLGYSRTSCHYIPVKGALYSC